MDNIKTGLLIKELRKEKSMTQKELAELLHLTDRAISKWERGICAPDISTLEPLAKILGVTVTELISGQRIKAEENMARIELNVQNVINYSENEIVCKTKAIQKKYAAIVGICTIAAVLLCLSFLWWEGYFNMIDRSQSPNKAIQLTIFNRDITKCPFKNVPALTIQSRGAENSITVYADSKFQGIWWAPDSTKYVLGFTTDKGTQLLLNCIEGHSSSNLNAYLSIGVEMNELAQYGLRYHDETPFPEIQYQFLQWAADSNSILVYYSFVDIKQEKHEGYFWYNSENGTVKATLDMSLTLEDPYEKKEAIDLSSNIRTDRNCH